MPTTWTDEKELIEEAANAFVLGIDLQDIADRLGCTLSQLKRWRVKYKWVERKAQFDTRLTGTIHINLELLEKAQQRMQKAMADPHEELSDLSAFLSLIIKMQAQLQEQKQVVAVDPMHIALVAMERFQRYINQHDPAAHEAMAANIEGFILDLQQNPIE